MDVKNNGQYAKVIHLQWNPVKLIMFLWCKDPVMSEFGLLGFHCIINFKKLEKMLVKMT